MTKERELLFTIVEQWGNAVFDKEQLLKNYAKEQAIAFGVWLNAKDFQSTRKPGVMRSIHFNNGEPIEVSKLYEMFSQPQTTSTDDNRL